jgi:DNA/RNA-binding domain of Phe-tRNA-synthetase-like protein
LKMKRAKISDAIFRKFPDFHRGIIVANDVNNAAAEPAIAALLAEASHSRFGFSVEGSAPVLCWDDAHRNFGSNPNKYPPSVKALLKRAAAGKEIPFINSVVASFNVISLKYLVPCGGDDLDKIMGSLLLGIADGSEKFVPLGNTNLSEQPDAGEIVYFDDSTREVMCRRWNWRNSDMSKIETKTRRLLINIDCLPPLGRREAAEARDELAYMLTRYCGANVRVDLLSRDRTEIPIE